ncbi:MBL fold metallo-hydrolase [Sphingomonas immobilis]|uniref:MBL fold metallo-hydrolase n=1 Tax=Sphingomonas immobilis TaxID=3063997 RepID=A0ABT8ZXI9_9SPHN|nr:MBL fold metallo-hydrolase [Sphingomonas sp. CA1-15]MDO7842288.1 MBL fold metallo-hydrolase [Sphingomonas sp. CA1-15]
MIDRVEELRFELPIDALTDDADFITRALVPFGGGFLNRERMSFVFCGQSWIVHVDGLIVLIDPCNGNGRKRPGFPYFEDLDTPWLAGLAAAGVAPEEIDIVFCTHLHCDHCGWNTRDEGGRWVPTFPNATYLFAAREVARWDPAAAVDPDPEFNEYNRHVFAESVAPVLAAGLARLIEPPYRVSPSLLAEAAPGHTHGHMILRLESAEAIAYFVGDTLHHPAQILRPDLHLRGCDDLGQAIATRKSLFARVAAERALIFPAHFPEPHHGRIVATADGFDFVPGEPFPLLQAAGTLEHESHIDTEVPNI